MSRSGRGTSLLVGSTIAYIICHLHYNNSDDTFAIGEKANLQEFEWWEWLTLRSIL